jgi:hypothetical protein
MKTPTHFYAFASRDEWSYYTNTAGTLAEAREDRRFLVKHGCVLGPIVKVPVPALPRKAKP